MGSRVEMEWASEGTSYQGTVIKTRADGGVVRYADGDISWETFDGDLSLVDGPRTEGGDRSGLFWENGVVSCGDPNPSLAEDTTLRAGKKVFFWSRRYEAGDRRSRVCTWVTSITIRGNPGETCPLPHVEFEFPDDLEDDRGVQTFGPEGQSDAMVRLEKYMMMHPAISSQEPNALAAIAH